MNFGADAGILVCDLCAHVILKLGSNFMNSGDRSRLAIY